MHTLSTIIISLGLVIFIFVYAVFQSGGRPVVPVVLAIVSGVFVAAGAILGFMSLS